MHDGAALLRSPGLAQSAARSLPAGEALLLRGNGALTLGATPGIAVARMWLLAATCEVYLAAAAANGPDRLTPLSADEVASWRAVRDELLPRLWEHLRRPSQAGGGPLLARAKKRARPSSVIIGTHQAHGLCQWTCEKNVSTIATTPTGSSRNQFLEAATSATASGGHR